MKSKSICYWMGMAMAISCLPLMTLKAQTRQLPTIDYANEVYYYDSVGNSALKLETGMFKVAGAQGHLFSTTVSYYIDGKRSSIRLSSPQPSFLLKLRSKDIDPLTYLGFCTLEVHKAAKARAFTFMTASKVRGTYTLNNDAIKAWTIKKVADDVVIMTPNGPLLPGEYSLFFFIGGTPREAFAFGID